MKKIITKQYKSSQVTQKNINTPQVNIQPYDGIVQDAVNDLKQKAPLLLNSVTDIVVDTGIGPNALGQVSSGAESSETVDEDGRVIRLNVPAIKEEVKQNYLIQDENSEEFQQAFKYRLEQVLRHELAHVEDHLERGEPDNPFPGGEIPAEQAAEQFEQSEWSRFFPRQ